jgi:hypothetical protein
LFVFMGLFLLAACLIYLSCLMGKLAFPLAEGAN